MSPHLVDNSIDVHQRVARRLAGHVLWLDVVRTAKTNAASELVQQIRHRLLGVVLLHFGMVVMFLSMVMMVLMLLKRHFFFLTHSSNLFINLKIQIYILQSTL